jgi:alpha-tubulin suppressor-like RCC1 family protein
VQGATGSPIPDSGLPYQATPTKVAPFNGDALEVQAAIGSRFACALRTNGTVWCWGGTFQGRIGRPDGTGPACAGFCDPTPNQVFEAISGDAGAIDAGNNAPDDPGPGPALSGVAHVRLGNGAACALKTNGTVWCWGNNYYDALGRGPYDALSRPYAQPISGLPGTIASIDRRLNATLAIEPGGNVWGWGEVTFGELAAAPDAGVTCNEATCTAAPVPLPALAGLNRLSAGAQHGIASKVDNSVWAFGLNDHAQLAHLPGAGGDVTCGSPQTLPPNAACHPAPVQVTFP